MQKELITVIIPVYKVESFLDRCITSIVNQTYRNMEIILVDDGSPDRCPEICDAWQRKDDRIKVIHKENDGVGMARNTGLDNAKGEYVFFVDSDDYVHQDMVKLCFESAKKESADVVHFGFYTVNSKIE